MGTLKYTKEEIEKFEKAMTTAINNLNKLWNLGVLNEIVVPVFLEGISLYDESIPENGWSFVIDKSGFYYCRDIKDYRHKLTFAKRNKFGRLVMKFPISDVDIIFLKDFENIRRKIVEQIDKAIDKKKDDVSIADSIHRKYGTESVVEIDMPRSQNIHEFEISEENGKKIGVINFGNQVVKIITEADIVLVNKQEDKVKSK